MKSEESPRNARVLPPPPAPSPILPRYLHLFIRGHPPLSPRASLYPRFTPSPCLSLYPPPPLLALPRSCVLFSRLSSFRVALFGASLQKTERTNDRLASRTMENIAARSDRFSIITRSRELRHRAAEVEVTSVSDTNFVLRCVRANVQLAWLCFAWHK